MHRNARWSPERLRSALDQTGYSLRQFLPAYTAFCERYGPERTPPLSPERLKVSHVTLRRWVKGERVPDVWQVEAVAAFLQRHQEWFYVDPPSPPPPSPKAKRRG